MIVDCKNCGTRFNLADGQVPAQGVRVRCSKCHHRFHVVPHGDTAVEAPEAAAAAPEAAAAAPEAAAAAPEAPPAEPQAQPPAPAPSAGGGADDPDLENPEFLFDGRSDPEDEAEPPPPAPPPPPKVSAQPGSLDQGFDGELGMPDPDEKTPAATSQANDDAQDVREQVFGMEAGRNLDPDSSPSVAISSEARASPAPASEASSNPLTGWEPDSDADDWSSAVGDVADAPSDPDSSAAATRTPVSLTPPSAPPEAEFETTASRLADTAVRTTALAIVLLLLLGGLRVMLGRGLGSLPGPETISAHGWMANEIEARHVRDALGRRVLVVQGRLVPQGPERAPRVHATLLDESGKPVTEGATAVLELLGPAALEPSALATRLDQGAPLWAAAASGPVSGFTVLIPDPPEDARRFRLDLSPAAGHI